MIGSLVARPSAYNIYLGLGFEFLIPTSDCINAHLLTCCPKHVGVVTPPLSCFFFFFPKKMLWETLINIFFFKLIIRSLNSLELVYAKGSMQ